MRLRLVSLAAILAVVAPAAPVWALSPDSGSITSVAAQPQAAPLQGAPVADLVARVDIPWSRFQLDNGLTVVVHTDRKAPVVAVSIWYNVGSKDEPAGSTGFAHLFEHLMFGGSENSPTSHIQAMSAAGATGLNGTTWFDRTNYFASFAANDEQLRWYLAWQADAMVNSFIAKADLDTEMTVVRNEMEMGENNPGNVLFEKTLVTLLAWMPQVV